MAIPSLPSLPGPPSSAEFDRLCREVERLRQQIAERDQRLAQRDQQIADQQERLGELEREIAELRKDSRTSHKPPASDPPAARACRPRTHTHTRRRPGAPPGHPGHGRRFAPPPQVTDTQIVLPPACRHCHAALPQEPAQARTRGPAQRLRSPNCRRSAL